jgi:RNA-binding protein
LLNPAQRKSLRKQAHHLKPIVFVGKEGMTETVVSAVKEAVLAHELIKVRFVDNKDTKKKLAPALAKKSKTELVGMIGHLAIMYREHPDEAKRKVKV